MPTPVSFTKNRYNHILSMHQQLYDAHTYHTVRLGVFHRIAQNIQKHLIQAEFVADYVLVCHIEHVNVGFQLLCLYVHIAEFKSVRVYETVMERVGDIIVTKSCIQNHFIRLQKNHTTQTAISLHFSPLYSPEIPHVLYFSCFNDYSKFQ